MKMQRYGLVACCGEDMWRRISFTRLKGKKSLDDKASLSSLSSIIKSDFWLKEVLPVFLAEVCGTAMLLFIGCLGSYFSITELWIVSFIWGLGAMGAVQISGPISGGHINPAVSIAATIMKVIKWYMLPVYVLAQFTGAILGFLLVWLLVPCENQRPSVEEHIKKYNLGESPEAPIPECHNIPFCITAPGANVGDLNAFGIEFCMTSFLVLSLCAIWDKRTKNQKDSVPLRVGFVLMACFIVAIPYSGGSLNPARTLAPELFFSGTFQSYDWIYWLGPILGGIVPSTLYWLLVCKLYDGEVNKMWESD